MLLRYPDYYERFQCIAGKCEDTCCAGWEIDIDDESYEYYRQVPGKFGERIRECIKEYGTEEDIYEDHGFILKEGKRCPFLNSENLCDMILELGEQSLCYVCTHTPRNYFEYDQTREISISPGCPEAGRLIFSDRTPVHFLEKESEEEFPFNESEEELRLAHEVKVARDAAVFLLQRRICDGKEKHITERLGEFLIFSKKIQDFFNQEKEENIIVFSKEVREGKKDFFFKEEWNRWKNSSRDRSDAAGEERERYENFCKRMKIFTELDSINENWEHALERIFLLFIEEESVKRYSEAVKKFGTYMEKKEKEYLYEHLLVYYGFLMLPRSLDDRSFWGKAQFVAVAFLMVRDMNIESFYRNMQEFNADDFMENVRFFAKEIEHSEGNMEMLEEEFLFEENYQLGSLLGQLDFV